MESLLFIAAFIGTMYDVEPQSIVEMLTGLSKCNARLVSLARQSRLSSSGGLSVDEARVVADAQNVISAFQKSTGINVILSFTGPGAVAVANSRLKLEFPGTSRTGDSALFIESLDAQLAAAEEENWDMVRDMMGYRVGLNIIDEHTEPFESLSESNVDYIEGKIRDGNTEGEMFESLSVDEADLRGYWKILS
jgi:hypothetical protein